MTLFLHPSLSSMADGGNSVGVPVSASRRSANVRDCPPLLLLLCFGSPEPGICSGNEDSCGNGNRNYGKVYFPWKKSTSILFSMKIKMIDLSMQAEGTQLIFVMNCSVLHFFKFTSRMPQIAQISVSTFKIFWAWLGGGDAPGPLRNLLFFFISNSRLCSHKIKLCMMSFLLLQQ